MSLPGPPSAPARDKPSKRLENEQNSHEQDAEGEGTGEAEDSTDPVTTHDLPTFSAEQVERMGMNEKLECVCLDGIVRELWRDLTIEHDAQIAGS